jgi:hypothetical protein
LLLELAVLSTTDHHECLAMHCLKQRVDVRWSSCELGVKISVHLNLRAVAPKNAGNLPGPTSETIALEAAKAKLPHWWSGEMFPLPMSLMWALPPICVQPAEPQLVLRQVVLEVQTLPQLA